MSNEASVQPSNAEKKNQSSIFFVYKMTVFRRSIPVSLPLIISKVSVFLCNKIGKSKHLILLNWISVFFFLSDQTNKAAHPNEFPGIHIENVQYLWNILKTFDENENISQWNLILKRHFSSSAAWVD